MPDNLGGQVSWEKWILIFIFVSFTLGCLTSGNKHKKKNFFWETWHKNLYHFWVWVFFSRRASASGWENWTCKPGVTEISPSTTWLTKWQKKCSTGECKAVHVVKSDPNSMFQIASSHVSFYQQVKYSPTSLQIVLWKMKLPTCRPSKRPGREQKLSFGTPQSHGVPNLVWSSGHLKNEILQLESIQVRKVRLVRNRKQFPL